MTATYIVKTDGIKDGYEKEHVVYQLVILFKRSKGDIQRMLDTNGFVIKRGIDLSKAIKYKAVLEQRGCVCTIEPEDKPEPFTIHSLNLKSNQSGSTQESAVTDLHGDAADRFHTSEDHHFTLSDSGLAEHAGAPSTPNGFWQKLARRVASITDRNQK